MSDTYRIDDFKKKYPHLAREVLEDKDVSLKLSVHMGFSDPWSGYTPTVVDYIRRCKSLEEAFKVVDYLVNHGELDAREGEELKAILERNGIEYFGGRKQDDYYYKEAKRYWEKIFKHIPGTY